MSGSGWLHGEQLREWVIARVNEGEPMRVVDFFKDEVPSRGRFTAHELVQVREWFHEARAALRAARAVPV